MLRLPIRWRRIRPIELNSGIERALAGKKRKKLSSKLARLGYCVVLVVRNSVITREMLDPDGPVVCITSYGERLELLFLTLESIAWGKKLPSQVMIWLSEEDCLDPPNSIVRLVRRGLELKSCEDLGPHKKYYPYCTEEFGRGRTMVTADDDVIYPRWWLAVIENAVSVRPNTILCYRATRFMISTRGRIAPYRDWEKCGDTIPSFLNLATGVSGIAYPHVFQIGVRSAGEGFRKDCSTVDDIWLHLVAMRNDIKIAQIFEQSRLFWVSPRSQKHPLAVGNVAGGLNDIAIERAYSEHDVIKLRSLSTHSDATRTRRVGIDGSVRRPDRSPQEN
jgi:hypothetical protein